MSKYLGPKCKICRRLGVKLCSKGERGSGAKCALVKRNYPPGAHGPKGHPRLTDYGVHLKEKQKVRAMYFILERQLRKYFNLATRSQFDTGTKLIELLERRLDNVIYRLGLAISRPQARQMVSHSLFLINNKKINVPSCQIKSGDVISFRKEKSLNSGILAENLKNIKIDNLPGWLEWDANENKAKIVELPKDKDLEIGIDTRLVVEYYSK
ncbi:30S ribosomal protein S4 [Candidatus Parcubacteria bacterium]|nr:30S ribosomal protein S4 [Patescibacteria group bacterium]MBU4482003.1 30S ribosomal protein S4 [Patescibacteria group bacterium]MCG2686897.1 30S ribosomal protein S4 [Candidatus Parcubacteria bacterium]